MPDQSPSKADAKAHNELQQLREKMKKEREQQRTLRAPKDVPVDAQKVMSMSLDDVLGTVPQVQAGFGKLRPEMQEKVRGDWFASSTAAEERGKVRKFIIFARQGEAAGGVLSEDEVMALGLEDALVSVSEIFEAFCKVPQEAQDKIRRDWDQVKTASAASERISQFLGHIKHTEGPLRRTQAPKSRKSSSPSDQPLSPRSAQAAKETAAAVLAEVGGDRAAATQALKAMGFSQSMRLEALGGGLGNYERKIIRDEEKERENDTDPNTLPLLVLNAVRLVRGKEPDMNHQVNYDLMNAFVQRKCRMRLQGGIEQARVQIVYHWTRENNFNAIVDTNLVVPGQKGVKHQTDEGYYGKGIYTSPAYDTFKVYGHGAKSCFLMLALPGRQFPALYPKHLGAPLQPGYDSHISGDSKDGPKGAQWVFMDSSQLLPLFIVDDKTKDRCIAVAQVLAEYLRENMLRAAKGSGLTAEQPGVGGAAVLGKGTSFRRPRAAAEAAPRRALSPSHVLLAAAGAV